MDLQHRVDKSLPLHPILSRFNAIQFFARYFSNIYSNIILLSSSRSPTFSIVIIYMQYCFPPTCYMFLSIASF